MDTCRRIQATLVAVLSLLGMVLLYWAVDRSVQAHIVPPEKLHPVVESYRRMTFLLNLNPVLWKNVREDFQTITRYYKTLDASAAAGAGKELESVLIESGVETETKAPFDPARAREKARRRVFEFATRTVAQLIVLRIEQAAAAAPDHHATFRHLEEARQLFTAFEKTLFHTELARFRELGQSWLAMASALGSPGILLVGAVPMDTNALRHEVANISDFLRANYGLTFQAPKGRFMAPLLSPSSSFDSKAALLLGLPPGSNINKQHPRPRQILNMAARGVDERETYLIALGDMAFDSSYIFGEPARSLGISCNTCHNKGVTNPQFVIPGISSVPGTVDVSNSFFGPHANNGLFDPLDIPDMRGIRFTAPYGRNGRFASLRDFVRNVIVSEFSGSEPDPDVLDGLVAYVLEIDYLPNSYLNPDGSLNEKASESARRGARIFHRSFSSMQNRSCATCHIAATFFLDRQRHDVGTVPPAETYGKDGALDTPTLLGIRFTAPYFHDGSLPTLRSVVDWFDKRYQLGLGGQEKQDLTVYLETVGDGVEPYEKGSSIVAPELEEFEVFMSTYETLLARGKSNVLGIVLRTVAFEVRAHKWDLKDPALEPVMEEMAQALDDAYEALESSDMALVDRKVQHYRALYDKYREALL